jgi:opacity protein-like surface antigen
MSSLKPLAVAVSGLFVLTPALAADVVQKVKPPVSQAYLDLATFSGGMLGMPVQQRQWRGQYLRADARPEPGPLDGRRPADAE